jgi:hypothetical protein
MTQTDPPNCPLWAVWFTDRRASKGDSPMIPRPIRYGN